MRPIKWETEASFLSEEVDLEDFVYVNQNVKLFIDSELGYNPYVIASKGMGKTLLLHYRRHICEKENPGALFLPSSHRMIDFPEEIRLGLSKEIINKLAEYDFCKRFWKLVLRLYILSGMQGNGDEILISLSDSDKSKMKSIVKSIFDGRAKSIGYIINVLLDKSVNLLCMAIDSLTNAVSPLFDNIHTSVYVFLDQLDQSFADVHKPIWITMQNSLLDAAWDIGRVNTHIKIYLSIRKEAYTHLNQQSVNAEAIQASVVQIEYTKDDLRNMLDHLVMYYEHRD